MQGSEEPRDQRNLSRPSPAVRKSERGRGWLRETMIILENLYRFTGPSEADKKWRALACAKGRGQVTRVNLSVLTDTQCGLSLCHIYPFVTGTEASF